MAYNNEVYGSLLQRSFIPKDLDTILTITSIPLDEVVDDPNLEHSEEMLQSLLADMFGVPESYVLTNTSYAMLSRFVEREANPRRGPEFVLPGDTVLHTPMEYRLATHALQLLSVGQSSLPEEIPYWAASNPYRFQQYIARVSKRGDVRSRARDREADAWVEDSRALRHLGVEALQTGLVCLNAALVNDARVLSLLTDLRDYDIPIAHSPKSESESLEKLIQTTKSVALMGLTASGTAAAAALARGEYVTALICAGTGSAVTLIFISTIAASAVLSSRAAQHIRSTNRKRAARLRPGERIVTMSELDTNRAEIEDTRPTRSRGEEPSAEE
jgi:hypothetical protein